MNYPTLSLLLYISLFHLTSLWLFNKIYLTSRVVVDEEFHLPLGIAYCKYDFSVWDDKITTLPGLYLLSTFILGPYKLCTTYWLRFLSLACTTLNIPLFYMLFLRYEKEWSSLASTITISLLPPLYFFGYFYYTDVISLTALLLMFLLYEHGLHYFASIFGMWAIICRQNNVIWVGMLLGRYVLVKLYKIANFKGTQLDEGIDVKKLIKFKKKLTGNPKLLLRGADLQFWLDSLCYLIVLFCFGIFVIKNGSIVVGDKTAHEVTFHFPQLFYFSLFCLVFAWPHFVSEVSNFFSFCKRYKGAIMLWITVGFLITHYNTLVHPYMLADNRHYIFYIWNRFYAKYPFFRYAMVPVYGFSWFVIIKTIFSKKDISFLLVYLPCVVVLLTSQKLIDVRYYFVPYVLFRLRVKSTANNPFNIILEFVTYVVTNAITFNLFFYKTITWSDYDFPQRLIW